MDALTNSLTNANYATSQFKLDQLSRNTQTKGTTDEKLMSACQDFEAIFVKQMLTAMKKTVQKSGLLDTSMSEDIFEDMLYDEYAKTFSRNGSLGMAKMIYDQLTTIYADSAEAMKKISINV